METSIAILVLVFFLSARQAFSQITPYTSDANTVLLDHFDGSTSASILGYIEDGAGDTQKASATPSYSYGPGPAGLGEALTLNPPAGEPLGSATYLKYSNELLSASNGSLDFYVYLTGYGTPGATLVEQGPYYTAAAGWTFNLGVDSTGRVEASAWAAFDVNSGTSVVKLNTWTQVAVTWGSAGAKLYIDGTLVGTDPNTGHPASGYGGSVLIRLGTSSGFSARIDELRISNIQRTYAPAGAPPAPIPVSPQSGWTGVSTSPTLMWNASVGATSYELQVSTDSTFATTIFDSSGITDTLKIVGGLSYQTQYFWRVNATGSSGTSLWSTISSFTTSGGSQSFWTPTGGPPGGDINALVADKLNGDVLAGTDSGIYVSTNNGSNWTRSGLSGSYVRALAVAPNGYIYAGNTSGVYISTDGGSTWNISNMTSNTLSLAIANSGEVFAGTFNSGISISTDNGSTWATRGLLSDEIYAIAVDSSGNIFAGIQSATNYNYAGVYRSTDGANSWAQVGLMGDELWALAIDSAGDIIAGTGQSGTFISTDNGSNWSQSNSGLSNTMIYSLTVSSAGDIFAGSDGSGVFESTDRGNSWNATGPTNRTYWSLAATTSGYVFAGADSGGVYRAGSGTSSNPPSPPTLLAPVNGATGTATELRLSWEASSGATSYRLQVSTDISFTSLLYDVGGLAAISDSMTGFATQTTYYWRINASNSAGTSGWSSVWDFTTGSQTSIPSPPVLSSPADGETGAPTSLNLIWEPSAGASDYTLQISTDASFSTNVSNTPGLLSTSDSVTGLPSQSTFYWHVKASNSVGTSAWSSTWSFTTGSGTGGGTGSVPSSPALISPVNYSTGLPTQLRFSWGPSVGATAYEFQISADTSFSNTVSDVSGLTTTSDSIDVGLSTQTLYYWRVDASDSAGTSPWSEVWQFTTGSSGSSLSPPTLSGPADGTADVWIDPVLSWNSASGATSYEIQVSTDPSFSTFVTDMSGLAATSYRVTGLNYGITYYWRVNATNSTGVSSWSTDYSFTTLTYPSTVQVSFESSQYLPTNDLSVSGYRMIGLPGNIDIPLANILPGEQKYDWDAYYDNGADQDYYKEYDGSSQFSFQPGRAFWILSRDSFYVDQNAPTVSLDTAGCYSISVHNGWNLISDPFMKSVVWSSVQNLNGISQSLFSFDGGFQQSTVLDPYYGYYFYNDIGLSELRIPYTNSTLLTGTSRAQSVAAMTLTATLSDGLRDWSRVEVGVSGSNSGKSGDIFAPPDNFEVAGMHVIDSSASSRWMDFAEDFRDTLGTGQEFDFRVTNKTGKNLSLKFDAGLGLKGCEIYLVDEDLSRSYNLNDTDMVSVPSYNKLKDFAILIGNKSFVDEKLAELAPHEFLLYQNYPNPFNPVTVIRFEVPSEQHVTLTIYDVLGRKVETLANANFSPGCYEIPFDGTRLASGVYFYRISAGSFTQVKKMVLLK